MWGLLYMSIRDIDHILISITFVFLTKPFVNIKTLSVTLSWSFENGNKVCETESHILIRFKQINSWVKEKKGYPIAETQ